MFGYPSLKEYLGIPTLAELVAFAVAYNFQDTWMANVFFWAITINVVIVPALMLTRQFAEQSEATEYTPRKPVELLDLQPTRASDNIPQIKTGGMLVHSQSVEMVSINAIKGFNQHLVTQHMGGLEINMTENYWVKKAPGMEQSRWVRIGGTGPTDWKNMMERGVQWKAYAIEGGLDKRVPFNWRKISQLAQGYPLPQLSTSPVQKRANAS